MKALRSIPGVVKTWVFAILIVMALVQMSQCEARNPRLGSRRGDGDVTPYTCGQGVSSQFVDVGKSEKRFDFGSSNKVLQVSTSAGSGNAAGCTFTNFSPNAFFKIEVLFYDPNPDTGNFTSLKLCLREPVSGRQFTDRVSLGDLDLDSLGNDWYRGVGNPRTNRSFNFNSHGADLSKVSISLLSGPNARTIKIGQVKIFIPAPIAPDDLIMSNAGCNGPNTCPSFAATLRD